MRRRTSGYTLLEILLVLSILGIATAVAMPMLSSNDPHALNVASQATADAIRFARDESMRTARVHGVDITPAEKRIRVFRADTSSEPWVPIYDVRDPVSKQLYDLTLNEVPFAQIDTVSVSASFRATCNQVNRIVFDRWAVPRCSDPAGTPLVKYLLSLQQGSQVQHVTLLGFSGRLSVDSP